MDCIAHGVTKSWTRPSNFHFHFTWKERARWKLALSLCEMKLFNLFTKPHFQHLETEVQKAAHSQGCCEVSVS